MARQLVFTSVPQGLTPGRTGYCTVARHRDLRDRLVPLLEGLSIYPSDWQPAPVVCAYRLIELAGATFPVLTRIVAAGHDYSHRAVFIAHHLVLDPGEIASAPSPVEVFMRWPGWRQRWDEPPKWFDESDLVDLRKLPPALLPALPAQTWETLANDAGKAALLLDGNKPRAWRLGCDPACEEYLLALFRESSALLDPAQAWQAEFTTCFQPTENTKSYKWAALRLGSPADTTAARAGDFLDLTQPESLPPAPSNATTERARSGSIAPAPIPVREPASVVAPVITIAAPVEKVTPSAGESTKPIEVSPPVAKPPPPGKKRLVAVMAILLLLGLTVFNIMAMRSRSNSPVAPQASNPPALTAPKAATETVVPKVDISSITSQPSGRMTQPAPKDTGGSNTSTTENPLTSSQSPRPFVQPASKTAAGNTNANPKANIFLAFPKQPALELIWIGPGTFTMGSPASEVGRNRAEGPQTKVTLTKGFWLGKYAVTQAEWSAIMDSNPSDRKNLGPAQPVDNISWESAMDFCRKLTEQERTAGRLPPGYEYTLPTEAQWEYACRAGSTKSVANNLDDVAWYNANSGGTSHPVGQKLPNAWGLFDMQGNIAQWVRDWYGAYPGGSVSDFAGPAKGTQHLARGSNFAKSPIDIRDAKRLFHPLNYQNNGLGLRVALAPVAAPVATSATAAK